MENKIQPANYLEEIPLEDYKPEVQDIIQNMVDYKLKIFKSFLIAKKGLKQLQHRKIVHIIFSKYIPLQILNLDCRDSKIGDQNLGDLKFLRDKLQLLPCSINQVELGLQFNQLGTNIENCKYLRDALKFMYNLQYLDLDMDYNNLGKDKINLRYLSEGIKQIVNIKELKLSLNNNRLGQNKENLKQLVQGFRGLKNIQSLELNLQSNYLGDNVENMVYLGQGLKYLVNLQSLELQLFDNNLGQNEDNLKYLGKGLKYLDKLLYFRFSVNQNNLRENETNWRYLGEGLKQLPNLVKLELYLPENNLRENSCLMHLVQGVKNMTKLEDLQLDLAENFIGEEMSKHKKVFFGDCLKLLPVKLQILKLQLYGNSFGKNGQELIRLAQGLKTLQNLQRLELNLTMNQLGEIGGHLGCLGECLEQMGSLKELNLNLSENGFGGEKEQYLGQILMHIFQLACCQLRVLNLGLSGNNVGEKTVKQYLGKGLEQLCGNSSLQYLNLDLSQNEKLKNNLIGSLAEYLKNMGGLKGLRVYLSGISSLNSKRVKRLESKFNSMLTDLEWIYFIKFF